MSNAKTLELIHTRCVLCGGEDSEVVASGSGSILVPLDGQDIRITSGSNGSEGTLTPNEGGGWVVSYPGGNSRILRRQ